MNLNLKPLGDKILVEPVAAPKQIHGIIIPENAQNLQLEAEVLAIGSKVLTKEVKVGDTVVYAKFSGNELKIDGKNLIILLEKDVLAVIEKSKHKTSKSKE